MNPTSTSAWAGEGSGAENYDDRRVTQGGPDINELDLDDENADNIDRGEGNDAAVAAAAAAAGAVEMAQTNRYIQVDADMSTTEMNNAVPKRSGKFSFVCISFVFLFCFCFLCFQIVLT